MVCRRRPGDSFETPIAVHWPYNVRADDYYGDNLTETFLDLARVF